MKKLLPLAGSFMIKNLKSPAFIIMLAAFFFVTNSSYGQVYFLMSGGGTSVPKSGGGTTTTAGALIQGYDDAIYKMGYTGTDYATVATNVGYSPVHIEMDGNNNRLFVMDVLNVQNNIRVYNLTTGAFIRTLDVAPNGATNALRDMVYDPRTDYLYFSTEGGDGAKHSENDKIARIKPDGTGGVEVIATATDLLNPYALELDMRNNRLIVFQSNFAARKLFFVDLATKSITSSRSFATSYGTLWSIAYDEIEDYVYYTVADGSGSVTDSKDMIRRQKSDGTGDELVLDNVTDNPYRLRLDLGNNRMFFTNGNYANMKLISLTLPNKLSNVKTIYAGTAETTNTYPFLRDFAIPRRATVTTADVSSITATSATFNGELVFGNGLITSSGFVYSKTTNPTLDNIDNVASIGNLTVNSKLNKAITGLSPSTTYYVRSYARNQAGTMYGELKTFKTPSNNANLTGLRIALGAGSFAVLNTANKTNLTYNVAYNISTVNIGFFAEQNDVTVKVNNIAVKKADLSGDISLNTGSNVITTVVTAEDGTTTKSYTLTITRAKGPQTISFAATAAKTYGVADFDPGASSSSTLPVTYTSSNPAVATIVNNKVHVIGIGVTTITASGAGNANYLDAAPISQTMTITPAVLTYIADNGSRMYGAPDPILTGTVTGFVYNDTKETATTGTLVFTSTATATSSVLADDGTSAATYPITGSGLSAANYTFIQASENAQKFIILRPTVTYKVTEVTKLYGADNPAFIVTFSGLVNGETIAQVSSYTIGTTATKTSSPGTYPVTVTGLSSLNYSFEPDLTNQTAFTIYPAPLTYVADLATRLYGTQNPSFSGKLIGFVNGDTEASATTGALTFGTTATVVSAAGNYAINGSGKTAANYIIQQDAANSTALKVTKNTLSYVATPVSRPFNTAGPSVTGSLNGFVNGDTQASATTGVLVFSTVVDNSTGVGSYPITGSGLSAANYDIVQSGGNSTAYSIYLSTNGNLSSLAISQGNLSPSFRSGTNSYKATVATGTASLTVTPALSDNNARVTVNGTQITSGSTSAAIALAIGENIIHVNVTAQDGTTTNPYIINVTRLPSQDASFAAFTVTGATVAASANSPQRFTGSVAKDVTSFNVTASVHEPNATLYVNGVETPSGSTVNLPLKKGENIYGVIIKAQDGTTYSQNVVVITRALSDIKTLASLGVSEGTLSPSFSPGNNNYTLAISNATTSVVFTPAITDTLSYITQDGLPALPSFTRTAVIGDNTFGIYVQAENGTQNVYNINVQRAVSHDASLTSLGITTATGTIEPFDPATLNYNTTVAYNVDALRLNPVAANSGATIKINGTPVTSSGGESYFQYFSAPETTQIEVTAGDGYTKQIYNITATRGFSDNNLLANLKINDGTVTLSPDFDPATETYSALISDPTTQYVLVTPTKGEDHQEVRVNYGQVLNGGASQYISLSSGSNLISIVSRAQNGAEKNYSINLTRAFSANADMSYAIISQGRAGDSEGEGGGGGYSHVFSQDDITNNALSVNVPNSVDLLQIYPGAADAGASATVNGYVIQRDQASANLALSIGDNVFNIGVTSADGTSTGSYTMHVNRLPFADVTLSALNTDKGIFDKSFSPAVTAYNVVIASADTAITITPVAPDPNAIITVNNEVINAAHPSYTNNYAIYPFGSTNFRVKVTAPDGINTQTYSLRVSRQNAGDASLAGIKLSSGSISPAFAAYNTSYTASVDNSVSTVNFTPLSAEPNANITVTSAGNTTTVNSSTPFAAVPLVVGDNVITTTINSLDNSNNQIYTVTITRGLPANDATLASLGLSNGSVSPAFNSATDTYSNNVPYGVDTIRVYPVATDINATIKIAGTAVTSAGVAIALSTGSNTIPVVVKAQDLSTTKTYTLTVSRGAVSTDATLSSLFANEGTLSPAFVTGTKAYTLSVASGIDTLHLTSISNDPNATATVNGIMPDGLTGVAAIPLVVGQNAISIAVTAQDRTTKQTYTLSVTRALPPEISLSNLTLSAGTLSPVFASGTRAYTATVANAVSTIRITPSANDATATVTVNGTAVNSGVASASIPLAIGANTISTVVTAQDGSTKTYVLTVTRAGSSNAYLSNLELSSPSAALVKLSNGPSATNFSASVPFSAGSIRLKLTTQDAGALVTINGVAAVSGVASDPILLSSNATLLSIRVTAADGTTVNTYSITVNKTGSSNAYLSNLELSSPSAALVKLSSGPSATNFSASVPVSAGSIRLKLTTQDTGASVTINGVAAVSGVASEPILLSSNATLLNIRVKAADGTTVNTYSITVNKTGSSNAYLSNLELSNPSSALVKLSSGPSATNFSASVPVSAGSIRLKLTTQDTGASVTINGVAAVSGVASEPILLSSNATLLNIRVKAADGTTVNTYSITVNKTGSSNAYLSNLELSNPSSALVKLSSGPSATNFSASVPVSAGSIRLKLTTQDAGASVTINGVAAVSGVASDPILLSGNATLLSIRVTAADAATINTYSITVNKASQSTASVTNKNTNIDVVQQPAITDEQLQAELTVHQAVSPNGDGINDRFTIDGIGAYPQNTVSIMNRNGDVIFTASGYDNYNKAFDGHAGNGTLQQAGTYFYSIEYKKGEETLRKTGYIVLKY